MGVEEKQRHYIHGDRHELDPELYYCSACAMFFAKVHFWKYHVEANDSLYESEVEHLDRVIGDDRHRPDDPENLFS